MEPEGSLPCSLGPILSQMNQGGHPVIIFLYDILLSTPRSSKWSLSLRCSHQNCVFSSILCVLHTPPISFTLNLSSLPKIYHSEQTDAELVIQVLTAVTMESVFLWNVSPCSVVQIHHVSEESSPPSSGSMCKTSQQSNLLYLVLACSTYTEDVSNTFLRNVGGPLLTSKRRSLISKYVIR
jgi:hypothetical protein